MAKRRSRGSVTLAAARLGAVVALGTAGRRIHAADERARGLIHAQRSQGLDRAMPALTDLGSTYAIAGASSVLWLAGRRSLARDVLAAGLIAWGAAQASKPVFNRARPYHVGEVEMLVREPAGLSYPSGHPAVAAAVARVMQPELRGPARGLVERMPKLVAFSRVYVGVHYPTDVIGGLLLGRAVGDLWLRFGSRRRR